MLPKIETITPKKAKEILNRNTHNRKISERTVRSYTRAMEEGLWRLNGETVKVAKDGTLIDGQHRMLACVAAGVAFETYVIYDLDPDTFDTVDVGKKRTAGDMLSVDGVHNATATAAAIRWIDTINNGHVDQRGRQIGSDEIRLIYAADSDAIAKAVTRGVSVRHILNAGVAGGAAYFFAKKSAIQCEEFFELLRTGVNMQAGHPVLVLRERFIQKGKTHSHKHFEKEMMATVIRAWNAFRAGEKVTYLKGIVTKKADGGKEQQPVIK